MKIAIEGCAHGELEKIYETIEHIEKQNGFKVDLLLCCGDFQSTRNYDDLHCMAVPKKFQDLGTFYKYYNGEKVAPILTIFIGGNHEASNYLQELPYGGWVAPNIYYLGLAGCVYVNGVRIGGLSGIFKGHDYLKGHHEIPPYNDETLRSVYHIRNLEVFRLKQLTGNVNIFMSHEWPRGVYYHGNTDQLLRHKRHFRDDINSNSLGNAPCEELLNQLQPDYWFAAHLHCKFAAIVPHKTKSTKFLALDKCLPNRGFLQIVDVPSSGEDVHLSYDLEWLTILSLTNHLLSVSSARVYMPNQMGNSNERFNFQPTDDEMAAVRKLFGNIDVPKNFGVSEDVPRCVDTSPETSVPPTFVLNQQTLQFCEKMQIDDPLQLVVALNPQRFNSSCFKSTVLTPPATYTTKLMRSVDMTKSVPIKMPPLARVLPKPKWIDSSNPDELELTNSSNEEDEVDEDAECSMNVALNESTLLSASAISDVDEVCELNAVKHCRNLPEQANEPPKKFKRRNILIYESQED